MPTEHSKNSLEAQFGKLFEGLGSHVKLAGFNFSRINPVSLLRKGWETNADGAHFATPKTLKGWVGEGNVTRHLPVGMKTLTAAGAASEAPAAFDKEDIHNTGKSRGDRIGSFVGGTLGGIAGSLPPRAGLLANVAAMAAGTIGGSYIGGKIGKAFDRPTGNQ